MQTNYNNELQVNNSTKFESVCIWCDLQFKNLWWKWVVYMFTMYSNWRNVIWKDETREGDSRKIDFDQQTHQFDTGYMCLSKKWDHRPYTVARDFYLYFMLTCFFIFIIVFMGSHAHRPFLWVISIVYELILYYDLSTVSCLDVSKFWPTFGGY